MAQTAPILCRQLNARWIEADYPADPADPGNFANWAPGHVTQIRCSWNIPDPEFHARLRDSADFVEDGDDPAALAPVPTRADMPERDRNKKFCWQGAGGPGLLKRPPQLGGPGAISQAQWAALKQNLVDQFHKLASANCFHYMGDWPGLERRDKDEDDAFRNRIAMWYLEVAQRAGDLLYVRACHCNQTSEPNLSLRPEQLKGYLVRILLNDVSHLRVGRCRRRVPPEAHRSLRRSNNPSEIPLWIGQYRTVQVIACVPDEKYGQKTEGWGIQHTNWTVRPDSGSAAMHGFLNDLASGNGSGMRGVGGASSSSSSSRGGGGGSGSKRGRDDGGAAGPADKPAKKKK